MPHSICADTAKIILKGTVSIIEDNKVIPNSQEFGHNVFNYSGGYLQKWRSYIQ